MTWKTILQASEKFITDNSPGILTGLGVAGTVTTAILTGKACFLSAELLEAKAESHTDADGVSIRENPFLSLETFHIIWKEFIPAAIAGTATITCIIAANQIGSRRAAAIAAAFKLSEKLSDEYKERVVKTLGLKNEEKMRAELASDRMAKTPGSELIIVAGSESIFFDEFSGRYFKCDMETVRKSVNDINYKINNYYNASLTDFYDLIGLRKTNVSDDVGWNTDKLLEIEYSVTLSDDGRPAISIAYNKTPIHGYDRCQ